MPIGWVIALSVIGGACFGALIMAMCVVAGRDDENRRINNMMKKEFDMVNNPKHYASGKIECIDAMEAAYGTEAVMWFCICNAFKYHWRFKNKNGIEDLKKAQWYKDKYIELENKLKGETE